MRRSRVVNDIGMGYSRRAAILVSVTYVRSPLPNAVAARLHYSSVMPSLH